MKKLSASSWRIDVGENSIIKLKWVEYEQAMIKQQKDIKKQKLSLNLLQECDNILRLKL